MQRLFVLGTAHIADPRLLMALEDALLAADPDQLILEMPDDAAISGDVASQKPEMLFAYNWARERGVPVRGHEPSGLSVLRDGLSPEQIDGLVQEMDALLLELLPRRIIDLFCARVSPEAPAERRLVALIDELIDREKGLVRTQAMIAAVRDLAAPDGVVLIVCGANHVSHMAAMLPGCEVIRGEHFY